MKRLWVGLAITMAFGVICSTAFAIIIVTGKGVWPQDWPQELEPLRKQSRTLVGPSLRKQRHAIPFAIREEFEAAWPHLMKVKTQGTSIVLRLGPMSGAGQKSAAGVYIQEDHQWRASTPDNPLVKGHWEQNVTLELFVDGEIIDLNRIHLPADTPIIDERFKEVPQLPH